MENIIQPFQQNDNEHLQAYFALFVFLICVGCAKEPEYNCENCNKLYKQEGRYRAHLLKCGGGREGGGGGNDSKNLSIVSPSVSEFSELLRQNREMMMLLQKQQDTIQTLVSQLIPVTK